MRIPTIGIRGRITLLACVAFGVAVVLGAVVLVWAVRDAVERSLDDRVRAAAGAVAAQVSDGRSEVTDAQVSTQVVDEATGQVLSASPDLKGVARFSTLPATDSVVVDAVPVLGWRDARVGVLRVIDPQGRPVLVYAAVDQDQAAESVVAARTAALFGVPLLIALLGAVVWVGVGRALRPVEDIRSQVADISARHLSRRVSEPPGNDGVTRLARTMNAMLDRLEAAASRQDRFVADVSHELHSPLASSRAELEVARAHPGSTDWSALTDELLGDNQRMTRVVHDLLFLARSDSNAPLSGRVPLDLDDVVRTEVRRLAVPPSVRVSTAAVEPTDLIGNPDELGRAVRNVLENAVRHAAGHVWVAVATIQDRARFAVADDGPGIDCADRQRVFERFTRLDDSRSRATGGAGLGLAITREIVVGHGGSITVTSADQGGACFVIDLPLAATSARPPADDSTSAGQFPVRGVPLHPMA